MRENMKLQLYQSVSQYIKCCSAIQVSTLVLVLVRSVSQGSYISTFAINMYSQPVK